MGAEDPALTTHGITPGPYEPRVCNDSIPTDCCNYAVVSCSAGREVCRVWVEADARNISEALTAASTPVQLDVEIEALKKERDDALDAVRLGRIMRQAQNAYFGNRSRENLIASKQAESAFDKAVRGLADGTP
jgi:hypothetical protein